MRSASCTAYVSFPPRSMPPISTSPVLKASAIFIANSLSMSAARVSASCATSVSTADEASPIALSSIPCYFPKPQPYCTPILVEPDQIGQMSRACINNTGRLEEFLFRGNAGFCTRNKRPLKTAYRLFAIKSGAMGALIDTQLQMKAFEKTLTRGLVPWLDGCELLKKERPTRKFCYRLLADMPRGASLSGGEECCVEGWALCHVPGLSFGKQ